MLAHDDVLDQDVFVRVVAPSVLADTLQAERIRTVAPAMTSLDMANCVRVVAFTDRVTPAAVITEWVPGPSLKHVREAGSLGLEATLVALGGIAPEVPNRGPAVVGAAADVLTAGRLIAAAIRASGASAD